MNKIKFVSLLTIPTGVITPVFYCSCSCSSNVLTPPTPLQGNIFEFINDRTFSIRDTILFNKQGQGWYNTVNGTMWLFYHDTRADNNYTYYALTNNHVTSGFQDLQNQDLNISKSTISFAYQNWDSAKTSDKRIKTHPDLTITSGEENIYNKLDTQTTKGSMEYTKFKTLFTTYLKSGNNKFYRDMTICRVDFSDYKDKPLHERLDRLNEYADDNNNEVLKFDVYSDTSKTTKSTMYAGGYPLVYLNSDTGYIYDNGSEIKFQDVEFTDTQPYIYNDLQSYINYANLYASAYLEYYKTYEKVYDADGTKDSDCYLLSPDWESPNQYDGTIPFGGGASGSLALRATDPNDINTYRATGIYWGGMESSSPWYFAPHFTPFSFNFGKNISISDISEPNIIKRFYASNAFTQNKVVNDCMYGC